MRIHRAQSVSSWLTLPKDWPGLTTARHRGGDLLTADRPDAYFSKRRPESVSLRLTSIAVAFKLSSPAEIKGVETDLDELVESEVKAITRKRKKAHLELLGRLKALGQSRHRRGNTRVFDLNPRFSSRDASLLHAAIAEERDFEARHQRARDRWIGGKRNTVFPHGTFGFHRLYNVRVAAHTGPVKVA